METNITVTLTDEQVTAGLDDARYLYPNVTNDVLKAKLKASATYGPGIYASIREWRELRVRQEENDNRKTEEVAFEGLFPPAAPVAMQGWRPSDETPTPILRAEG